VGLLAIQASYRDDKPGTHLALKSHMQRHISDFSRLLMTVALCALVPMGCDAGSTGGNNNDDDPPFDFDDDPFPENPFPDDDVCADVNVLVNGLTPTVQLVIDQSGSMTENFGGQDRWDAVYNTLMGQDGIVDRLDEEVRFGLSLYTSFGGNDGGTCPVIAGVPPALGNYGAIDAQYGPAVPEEDTPTGEAINAVAAQLRNFTEPGPKIIILGTDGEPDTCAEPNPQNGQGLAVQAAQAAFDSGIRTFVISVGDDVGAEHLQDMANAGVGLDPNGTENADFYVALNAGELSSAFDQIVGGVQGCVFTLQGEVDPAKGSQGLVKLDGDDLQFGDDWILLDGKTFEIIGARCDQLQDGNPHQVSAVFPCGTVIVE
jgi:hypothetical protein